MQYPQRGIRNNKCFTSNRVTFVIEHCENFSCEWWLCNASLNNFFTGIFSATAETFRKNGNRAVVCWLEWLRLWYPVDSPHPHQGSPLTTPLPQLEHQGGSGYLAGGQSVQGTERESPKWITDTHLIENQVLLAMKLHTTLLCIKLRRNQQSKESGNPFAQTCCNIQSKEAVETPKSPQ